MKNLNSINSFSLQLIKSYTQTSDHELDVAIKKTEQVFKVWGNKPLSEKLILFKKLSQILLDQKNVLAEVATKEMGKPLNQAVLEVEKCASACDYYIENAAQILKPQTIKTDSSLSYISHEPLGCILGVMPWNFPYWQVLRFAIPTLMSGNTILLKHASNVSGCALLIEDVFKKAGFPDHIFKTLLISSDRVEGLISNPVIKGVSLTGSTEAGRKVAEAAGRYLKKLVLELGGSDPYLILADADLKLAAEISMKSRLQNNGQSCIAAKRFIVLDEVYDSFKNEILLISNKTKFGDPMNSNSNLGPLARKDLKLELHAQVLSAVENGAKIAFQGDINLNDAFYPVTILENVDQSNPAYTQEFFGPVVMLFKVKSVEQAIQVANGTSFGLGSAVFSQNVDYVLKEVVPKLESGNCFVNTMVKSDPRLPFGGIKESGYGRELSTHGMLEFTNIKTVNVS